MGKEQLLTKVDDFMKNFTVDSDDSEDSVSEERNEQDNAVSREETPKKDEQPIFTGESKAEEKNTGEIEEEPVQKQLKEEEETKEDRGEDTQTDKTEQIPEEKEENTEQIREIPSTAEKKVEPEKIIATKPRNNPFAQLSTKKAVKQPKANPFANASSSSPKLNPFGESEIKAEKQIKRNQPNPVEKKERKPSNPYEKYDQSQKRKEVAKFAPIEFDSSPETKAKQSIPQSPQQQFVSNLNLLLEHTPLNLKSKPDIQEYTPILYNDSKAANYGTFLKILKQNPSNSLLAKLIEHKSQFSKIIPSKFNFQPPAIESSSIVFPSESKLNSAIFGAIFSKNKENALRSILTLSKGTSKEMFVKCSILLGKVNL